MSEYRNWMVDYFRGKIPWADFITRTSTECWKSKFTLLNQTNNSENKNHFCFHEKENDHIFSSMIRGLIKEEQSGYLLSMSLHDLLKYLPKYLSHKITRLIIWFVNCLMARIKLDKQWNITINIRESGGMENKTNLLQLQNMLFQGTQHKYQCHQIRLSLTWIHILYRNIEEASLQIHILKHTIQFKALFH